MAGAKAESMMVNGYRSGKAGGYFSQQAQSLVKSSDRLKPEQGIASLKEIDNLVRIWRTWTQKQLDEREIYQVAKGKITTSYV